MKKFGLATVALALIAVVAFFQLPCATRAFAQISGCCMTRAGDTEPWQFFQGDLETCRRANAADEPADNVFEETGNYWWNPRC